MTKGQVISGEFGKIVVRQKSGEEIELGELLIAESEKEKILLQVIDLMYGSQLSQQHLELISGLDLDQSSSFEFMDPQLRNYTLAVLKNLISISHDNANVSKVLPKFFSAVREIKKEDIRFLTKPKNPLFIGNLRSGSKMLDVDIFLPGDKVFAHHILIPATTGRGKSNLTSCMLWNSLDQDYCGILVLDPHDEYYGRDNPGLKDHPSQERVIYYTIDDVPPGQRSLKVHISLIRPTHFNGVIDWSMPQREALNAFYKRYGKSWIEAIILEKPIDHFNEGTLAVIKRRLLSLLDLEFDGQQLFCNGIFDLNAGINTIKDICSELENAKTVIVDTSSFEGAVEILVGSLIATEILDSYKRYKIKNQLKSKPVISIIIEEAPRVLGKEVLENGPNIFSTIAREGRKFKVGLTAITQLPSLIPRQILANMNTKIILGIEMAPERQAIIESASQDLSEDNRTIASLDIGEAILSSNFSPFAIPIKIPLFEEMVKKTPKRNTQKTEITFSGLSA